MRLLNRWVRISIIIITAISSAAWIWYSRSTPSEAAVTESAPQIGFPAPDFTLPTLDGGQLTLSDYQNSAVILNLWASWCPPCRSEMPALQQIHEEFSDRGLVVIALNATKQDSIPEIKDFVQQNDLTFPVPLDLDGSVSQNYRLFSLPSTYFIGPDGKIQQVIIGGPMPLSQIRIEAQKLIRQKP